MTYLFLRQAVILCLLTCLHPDAVSAQSEKVTDDADMLQYFTFESSSQFSCLLTLFPPIMLQHESQLKDFILSKEFSALREHLGDKRAMDAIYVRAMNLTDGNTGISLLIAAFATFDHEIVEFKIPMLSFALPLTGEEQKQFKRRVNALPKELYTDTPTDSYGDKDKLQHFFGSAFIAFAFESAGSARRAGVFVEKGERLGIRGGVYDNRDLRADDEGARYGIALLQDNHRLPSDFLRIDVTDESGEEVSADSSAETPASPEGTR